MPPGQPPPADVIYKIPVAILTDSLDPRIRPLWEKRIRKRLAEASDIFEHHCRVRFEVVSVGNWISDPANRSFDQALMEFAQKVRPAPARLAIGFTSYYQWVHAEMHLGGTHGALASHVLIRESPGQVSEPERLEVLVHELGHFLGAAHTSDKSSVMRPMLGDRKAAAKILPHRFRRSQHADHEPDRRRDAHTAHLASERAFANGEECRSWGLHGLGADHSAGPGVDIVDRVTRSAAGASRAARRPEP